MTALSWPDKGFVEDDSRGGRRSCGSWNAGRKIPPRLSEATPPDCTYSSRRVVKLLASSYQRRQPTATAAGNQPIKSDTL